MGNSEAKIEKGSQKPDPISSGDYETLLPLIFGGTEDRLISYERKLLNRLCVQMYNLLTLHPSRTRFQADINAKLPGYLKKYPKNSWICFWLGTMAYEDCNDELSWSLFKKSSKLNNSWGHFGFGMLLLRGHGKENSQNQQKAFSFFQKSQSLGCPGGDWGIGQCYRFGIGVEKNVEKAFSYFTMAAKKGLFLAHRSIANQFMPHIPRLSISSQQQLQSSQKKIDLPDSLFRVGKTLHKLVQARKNRLQRLNLVLCARQYEAHSPLFFDYLPLDLFKFICKRAKLY